MNSKIFTVLTSVLVILVGCSNVQQPLIFTSESNVGLDVGISPTETDAVKIDFGVKLRDFAFVPTTVVDKNGRVHNVRGCFRQVRGKASLAACQTNEPSRTQLSQLLTPGNVLSRTTSSSTKASLAGTTPPLLAVDPPSQAGEKMLLLPIATGGAQNLPATGEPGQESMIDSLSTYSSFNSKASANGSAQSGTNGTTGPQATGGINVDLGKVFATGVAAQQLTEGQNYYMQLSGLAAKAHEVASCLTALQSVASAAKVAPTAAQIDFCGGN